MKTINHYLRLIAAVIGVILPITNAVAWPASIKATVMAISGALLTVEHAIQSHEKMKVNKP